MPKPPRKGYWIALLLVLALASLALGCTSQNSTPTATAVAKPASATPAASTVKFANPDLLVDSAWVAERLNDPTVRVVDVRSADKYKDGHIKNAVNLPGDSNTTPLYDQNNATKWMVVPQDKFEVLVSDLGIDNDTTVVAVDDADGLWAARLFWTLEYYGHNKAKVLNGGLKQWKQDKRDLVKDVSSFPKAKFVANPQPQKYATKDQVLSKLGDPKTVIIASVGADEYTGQKVLSKRGGHIPGAVNIDWIKNLTAGDTPVLKSATELDAMYRDQGVTKDKDVVVY